MSQIRVIVVCPEEAYDDTAEFWCGGELMGVTIATEAASTAPSRARDGARRIVARLDPATGARPGARMTLGVESARVYLFDAATGSALAGAAATLAAA
jgi:hypothetical protein